MAGVKSLIKRFVAEPDIPSDAGEQVVIRTAGSVWTGSLGALGLILLTDRRIRFRRTQSPLQYLLLRTPRILDVPLSEIVSVDRGHKRDSFAGALTGATLLVMRLRGGGEVRMQSIGIDRWEREIRARIAT